MCGSSGAGGQKDYPRFSGAAALGALAHPAMQIRAIAISHFGLRARAILVANTQYPISLNSSLVPLSQVW